MREIKFRAWDKELKQILDCNEFYLTVNPRVKGWYEFEDAGNLRQREVEIMQFTGLSDKQGKEIFEGDILKISDNTLPEFRGKIVSVIFLMGAFRDSYYHWVLESKEKNFEVIGNIYENPELLKENNPNG